MTNPSLQDRKVFPTGMVDLAIARISASRLEEEYAVHKQACDRLATRIAEAKKKGNEEEQGIERDTHDPAWEGWPEYAPPEGYRAFSSGGEISFPKSEETDSEDSEGVTSCYESDVGESEESDDEISLLRLRLERGNIFGIFSIEGSDPILYIDFTHEEEELPTPEVEEIFVSDDEETLPEGDERVERAIFEPLQAIQEPEMTPQAFEEILS